MICRSWELGARLIAICNPFLQIPPRLRLALDKGIYTSRQKRIRLFRVPKIGQGKFDPTGRIIWPGSEKRRGLRTDDRSHGWCRLRRLMAETNDRGKTSNPPSNRPFTSIKRGPQSLGMAGAVCSSHSQRKRHAGNRTSGDRATSTRIKCIPLTDSNYVECTPRARTHVGLVCVESREEA